ncbi:unnamed protein product [Arabidopsis thaliana]|uniref:Uncharacterized protein n=1 Tax=Arabidopsis thaliana TaxID=3702 RepID=A0A654G923_ARATH|nr:unnamed protein product [Arabidopsis thaliana]
MGTPEFPDLGKHCSVDVCTQIDFLPFTCDRCLQVLCLDHCSYMLNPDEDSNITWDKHVNDTDCDPSNYENDVKKKKKQCPVSSCSGPKEPDSSISSTNTTVAATSAPASSSSSSISSASFFASAEARFRKTRLNRTRLNRARLNPTREDEDPRVENLPLWMIREGVADVVRGTERTDESGRRRRRC